MCFIVTKMEEENEIKTSGHNMDMECFPPTDETDTTREMNFLGSTSSLDCDGPPSTNTEGTPDAATSKGFSIDKSTIPCIAMNEQNQELEGLDVFAYDQGQFEAEVMDQVDQAMQKEEENRFKLRMEKELNLVNKDIQVTEKRVNQLANIFKATPSSEQMVNVARKNVMLLKKEYDSKVKHLKKLEAKQCSLNACISGNKEGFENSDVCDQVDENATDVADFMTQTFVLKESEEDKLIRTGQMTPFGTVIAQSSNKEANVLAEKVATGNILPSQVKMVHENTVGSPSQLKQKSASTVEKCIVSDEEHTKYRVHMSESCRMQESTSSVAVQKPLKRLKKMKLGTKYATGVARKSRKKKFTFDIGRDSEISDFENGDVSDEEWCPSDDDYIPEQQLPSDDSDQCFEVDNTKVKKKRTNKCVMGNSKHSQNLKKPLSKKDKVVDDGLQQAYIERIRRYEKEKLVIKHKKILESEDGVVDSDDEKCVEFDNGYKVPEQLWNRLYRYQQTGVRWLWELHQQNCGGIVGDEMGLGKTIQVIVFLAGLKTSGLQTPGDSFKGLGPVLLVCPTTVMHQWVKEFHSWWPPFCVAILHESGSFVGKKENLIATINKRNGVLVTSYVGLVQHQKCLLKYDWDYIILDEGHKIRNPDAQATLVAKQIHTAHRLILSGSPVQNNLKELWSLFDFVFPGKLGTLPVFMQQFSVPIVQGGYANASQVQVQTAYKCATVLRDTIKPYLLRRMKADVKMSINLPNKNEQVLFCKLTEDQMQLYKDYLGSPQVKSILDARLQVFVGLIHLRKICNHPDLYSGGPKVFKDTDTSSFTDDMQYGYYKRSGKMVVVDALLRLWHKQGHRVLLFTQSRQMMEILEIFVKRKEYTYMKMDGSSSISSRQPAIEKFNSDPSIFVFLLTTRVGGIGVNLTGANRIIIYDPDWNPSTDAQARERCWRIGQDKQVTIYRLLTAGTIEEKIYHRQIFKQFVTNRVLKDPRQRRFFKSNDLYELFTFSEMGKEGTETSAIFAGTGSEVKPIPRCKNPIKKSSPVALSPRDIKVSFSSEKIAKMKELAKKISSQLLNSNSSQIDRSPQNSEKPSSHVIENNVGKEKKKDEQKECNSSNSNSSSRLGKHRKLHKKKRHKVVVDGKEIDFLVKKDIYKPNDGDEEDSAKDDYVLSRLFKKSGVHAALKHDVIVDASDPDYMLVEGEANRVAEEAVKALRRSRRQCAPAAEGIPTWTGSSNRLKPRFGMKRKLPGLISKEMENKPSTSGLSSKPPIPSSKNIFDTNSEKKAIPSSSDLLSSIREIETFKQSSDSDSNDSDVPRNKIQQESELLDDIRSFIAFGSATNGQATTEELLQEFRPKLPLQHTAVFKSLLTRICDFSRMSGGDGLWSLKPEFR